MPERQKFISEIKRKNISKPINRKIKDSQREEEEKKKERNILIVITYYYQKVPILGSLGRLHT